MEVFIKVNNSKFEFNADSYEYKCMIDFKEHGNGYLDVSKCYPTSTVIKYENSLLQTGFPDPHKLMTRPYRFWTGKKFTKVWIIENDIRKQMDIHELRLIGDWYHVKHVVVQLLKFNVNAGNYGTHYSLRIRDIYLEEN